MIDWESGTEKKEKKGKKTNEIEKQRGGKKAKSDRRGKVLSPSQATANGILHSTWYCYCCCYYIATHMRFFPNTNDLKETRSNDAQE